MPVHMRPNEVKHEAKRAAIRVVEIYYSCTKQSVKFLLLN